MAQTRTPYLIIDDGEVDAESPVTESLMTRLRDQWYGALCDAATTASGDERVLLPARSKTSETDITKRLAPNGTGGTAWVSGVPNFIGVKGYRNTATSSFGGSGKLNWPDTVYDSHSFLTSTGGGDPVNSDDRITIPTGFAGIYTVRIKAQGSFSSLRSCYLELNGTAFDGSNGGSIYQFFDTEHEGTQIWKEFSVYLAEGDYLEVWARGTASAGSWVAGAVLDVIYHGPIATP